MIKIIPTHRKILEVAKRFDESSCGTRLIDVIQKFKGPNPDAKLFLRVASDPLLKEAADDLGVKPGAEYSFSDFLSAVAVAQVYIQREEIEYLEFNCAIKENYHPEVAKTVHKQFLDVADSLGFVELNFINFITDTLGEIYAYKRKHHSFSFVPNVPRFLKEDFSIRDKLSSGNNGFALDVKSHDYKKCVALLCIAKY